jgi:hypothetical protein
MIQTSHGIHLPPRKKKNRPKSITLRFVITGTIPSKKNRQIPAINWKRLLKQILHLIYSKKYNVVADDLKAIFKDNKPYIRQSEKFREWHEKAKLIIVEQAAKLHGSYSKFNLEYPISEASIKIYHYWKDNVVRDNSNKSETIHDLFKDTNIITDDCWQALSPIAADAGLYAGEITDHITVIDLTAYKW